MTDRDTLIQWDDDHLWHPFTPQALYREEDPVLVKRGEGCWLIDVDGRRLLDGVSSLWCAILGHRHPDIDAAVRAQLDQIAHSTLLGNSGEPAIRLARKLVEITPPDLTRVFFSDNGSTAAEVALKMAFQAHKLAGQPERRRFLTVGNAYHGDTIGAVSLGSIELFHRTFGELLFSTLNAPSPYCHRCPLGLSHDGCAIDCAKVLEDLARENADTIAAIVVEPVVQGAAGMITQPPGWLKRVAAVAKEIGAYLILDEVAVGFGRTGKLFALEHDGIEPDFLCLAKGLTAGYMPVAATMTTEAVYQRFLGTREEPITFFHGHTFTGNALGCAAALATLDVIERDDLVAEAASKAKLLETLLERLWPLKAVADIRQRGLAVGIELNTDEPRVGQRVCLAARTHGVFLRPLGNVIVLMPPLIISDDELELLVSAVEYGIQTVMGDQ